MLLSLFQSSDDPAARLSAWGRAVLEAEPASRP